MRTSLTKEQLKSYINEAIDALHNKDIEALFPTTNQPDLYALIREMTGLRGEFKKLAQSTLMLNNNVSTVIEKSKTDNEELVQGSNGQEDIKALCLLLLEQDDIIRRTAEHFSQLPEPTPWRLEIFKNRFTAWQEGYDISINQWDKFMKQSGLFKTGMPGELFDPQYHEAIATKADHTKANNIILETEVTGYLYKTQLIRYAKVTVNKI